VKNLIQILSICVTFLLVSCSVQDPIPQPQNVSSEKTQITPEIWHERYANIPVENGMLVFTDFEEMVELEQAFLKFSYDEKIIASQRDDFESFYNIYENVREMIDLAIESENQSDYEELLANNSQVVELSLDQIIPSTGNAYYTLSPFLNSEKIVKADQSIYLFDKTGEFISKQGNLEILKRVFGTGEQHEEVVVIEHAMPEMTRTMSCPLSVGINWTGRVFKTTNPRRSVGLNVQTYALVNYISATQDFTARARVYIKSTSYRGSGNNRYNTRHYSEYDFVVGIPGLSGTQPAVTVRFKDNTQSNGDMQELVQLHTVSSGTGLTQLQAENAFLPYFIQGQTEIDRSHRGMEANRSDRWVRFRCL